MKKIYLQKQDKNVEKNKLAGNEKLPYFRLFLIPEEDGGEWTEVGALWKAKSGKGYSGKIAENIDITVKPLTEEQIAQIQALRGKQIDAGVEGIKADEIPFD